MSTHNFIDIKKAKLAIIDALIEGGHEDRLMELVGQATQGPAQRQAQDLHDQHPDIGVQRGGAKGQLGWVDGPGVGNGPQRRQDHDAKSVHYHGPDTVCPLWNCPLDRW